MVKPSISIRDAEIIGIPSGLRANDPELVDYLDSRLQDAERVAAKTIPLSPYIAAALRDAIKDVFINQQSISSSTMEVYRVSRARGMFAELSGLLDAGDTEIS